jgi:transposase
MNRTRQRGKAASSYLRTFAVRGIFTDTFMTLCIRKRAIRGIFKDTFTKLAQRTIKDAEEQNAVAAFIIRLRKTHRALTSTRAILAATHKSEMRQCPQYSA